MTAISLLWMTAGESFKPSLCSVQCVNPSGGLVTDTCRSLSGTVHGGDNVLRRALPGLTTWKSACTCKLYGLPGHGRLWPSDSSSLPAWLQLQCHEKHEGPSAELCCTPAREKKIISKQHTMQQQKEAGISYLFEEEMVCQMIENHWIRVVQCICSGEQLHTDLNRVHLATEAEHFIMTSSLSSIWQPSLISFPI